MMDLLIANEYPAYKTVILQIYGETVIPPPTGKPSRPTKPYLVAPEGLRYATVHRLGKKGAWSTWDSGSSSVRKPQSKQRWQPQG